MNERTVRVRIAVAVQPDGYWHAYGDSKAGDNDNRHWAGYALPRAAIHWVEADVPLPSEATVEGEVRE